MRIYTRSGDDGTTGLLRGGRVPKNAPVVEATGAVDEAQAALGLARCETPAGSELHTLLVGVQRDLYVVMAELAAGPADRSGLRPGVSLVVPAMVGHLERRIDELTSRFPPVREFVLPGGDRCSAALDLARTVVRRAERAATGVSVAGSLVGPYLNRLSDLVWTMARWQDGGRSLPARPPGPDRSPPAPEDQTRL